MKTKKCKACKAEFKPFLSTQKACSTMCALTLVREQDAKEERADTRKRKEALKTKREWLKDAQVVFNRYIRTRDANEPCISCQGVSDDDNLLTGSRYDAGHFFSVGAHPAMRFDERNCHKQCSSCNNFKSGNIQNYRVNLIKKMGRQEFERFETEAHSAKAKKYTIDYLKELIKTYRAKTKELEKMCGDRWLETGKP